MPVRGHPGLTGRALDIFVASDEHKPERELATVSRVYDQIQTCQLALATI